VIFPFLLAVAALIASGLAAWSVPRRGSAWVGMLGALTGAALGSFSSFHVLARGETVTASVPWSLPLASLTIAIDPLSAFFLLPMFALSAMTAIYGFGYWRSHAGRGPAGTPWLWFNLLVAAMAVVVTARNGVLFLFAWEIMTIASYFLVTLHDESAQARAAGRIYLIAAHVGTAFLLVLFLLLAGASRSLDFDTFRVGAGTGGALFFLALVGFGVKAGLVPFHVWLPEAHPAAPSHVSALLSGSMITMGVYGLLRVLPVLGPPPALWGWTLLVLGLVSALLGVLYSLAQRDLKRLLAYSSVENTGIVACGLGLGLLGTTYAYEPLQVLGFGAALLHVVNHAAFKGLLFLGAGAVIEAAHSGELDYLGGLLKRLRWTGTAFFVGAAAIAGLPPLNGFASEFLLYLGAFHAVATRASSASLAGAFAIAGLGLTGGLATATFARAFGIAFLGEPRFPGAQRAREVGPWLLAPMALLAVACLALGLGSVWVVRALGPVLSFVTRAPAEVLAPSLAAASVTLMRMTAIAAVFLALVLVVAGVRKLLLAGRPSARSVTWDCGYAAPSPRAAYTASSFAQPILDLFAPMLGTRVSSLDPLGPFPADAGVLTTTPDSFRERVFGPFGRELGRQMGRLRRIQEGRVQVYVLYIALTLLALLVFEFARFP